MAKKATSLDLERLEALEREREAEELEKQKQWAIDDLRRRNIDPDNVIEIASRIGVLENRLKALEEKYYWLQHEVETAEEVLKKNNVPRTFSYPFTEDIHPSLGARIDFTIRQIRRSKTGRFFDDDEDSE